MADRFSLCFPIHTSSKDSLNLTREKHQKLHLVFCLFGGSNFVNPRLGDLHSLPCRGEGLGFLEITRGMLPLGKGRPANGETLKPHHKEEL